MKSEALYRQKKSILQKTETWRTSVMHDDRHFGTFWALMHGVDRADIEHLGHWKEDIMDLHYAKIYTPNVMAKMAGFENSRQYFIPRAQIDPFHVDDDEIKAMERSVFPLIDDEDFVKGIQQVS